jgi:hypothetical protein
MKIRLTKSFRTYEVYEEYEFNPEGYSELKDLSDDEIINYLNENMYDLELEGSGNSLYDELNFETDMIRDKIFDEESSIVLIKEK